MDGKREDRIVPRKKGRGSVALVHVAVHHHGGANGAFALQHPDGDGEVVDGAEAFPVSGERVMEAAAHVEADAVLESEPAGQRGAARRQPEGLHRLPGVRNLEPDNVLVGHRPGLQLANPFGGVHQAQFIVRGRRGLGEILRAGQAFFNQAPVHQPVLSRWKDMIAQVQVVAFMVNESKWQHRARLLRPPAK
jgi:hypothetical protein